MLKKNSITARELIEICRLCQFLKISLSKKIKQTRMPLSASFFSLRAWRFLKKINPNGRRQLECGLPTRLRDWIGLAAG